MFEKLQANLRKKTEGLGSLNDEQWRSFNDEGRMADAKDFIGGDLIVSFVDLSSTLMQEISTAVDVSVVELLKLVEELKGKFFSYCIIYSYIDLYLSWFWISCKVVNQ